MKDVYAPLMAALEQQAFFAQIGHPEKLAIISSPQCRTLELQVSPSGSKNGQSGQSNWQIELRVPARASLRDLQNFLLRKQRWLARQGRKFHQQASLLGSMPEGIQKLLQHKNMAVGQPILFLGESFLLQKHSPQHRSDCSIQLLSQPKQFEQPRQLSFPCRDTVPAQTSPAAQQQGLGGLTESERKYLEKALRQAALKLLQSRCQLYSQKMAAHPSAVKIRKYKARWGCCSPNGELIFNWQLIFAPLKIVDYVVVHELAHLLEFNHSKKFWQQLDQLLPDYQLHKQWLQLCGHLLLRF